jgi:hypothetical protein
MRLEVESPMEAGSSGLRPMEKCSNGLRAAVAEAALILGGDGGSGSGQR